MAVIKVIKPGFQTTVQDLGRIGYSHFGISLSGAADQVALRIGNMLVGNDQNATALELTLVGGEFEFQESTQISITGSNFQPRHDNKEVPMWTTLNVKAGQILSFQNTLDGARCYLCISGGFAVPKILGSASTHLLTSLGGLNGRPLIKGDSLTYDSSRNINENYYRLKKEVINKLYCNKEVYVTKGPQINCFSYDSINIFTSSYFIIREDSNRMGLRLTGPKIERLKQDDIITEGVSLGAIQISYDAQPIILFVEHQTTGGYPKIANVISADHHRLGQLKPRDEIKFSFVSIDEAYKLRKEIETLVSINSFEKL